MHSRRLDFSAASDRRRLPRRGGAGFGRQEQLLEQPQHHEQAHPTPPDDGVLPRLAGAFVAVASEPGVFRRRPRRRPLGQRARLRGPGELLVEVLPQHVHLVLHGEPRRAVVVAVVASQVVVVITARGLLLRGREAPSVLALVDSRVHNAAGDDEPRGRGGEVREGGLVAGVAVLKRDGGECELFHCCCCSAALSSLSQALSDSIEVRVQRCICGEVMEVATSLSTTSGHPQRWKGLETGRM